MKPSVLPRGLLRVRGGRRPPIVAAGHRSWHGPGFRRVGIRASAERGVVRPSTREWHNKHGRTVTADALARGARWQRCHAQIRDRRSHGRDGNGPMRPNQAMDRPESPWVEVMPIVVRAGVGGGRGGVAGRGSRAAGRGTGAGVSAPRRLLAATPARPAGAAPRAGSRRTGSTRHRSDRRVARWPRIAGWCRRRRLPDP